jgi:hypothetical protein
MISNINIYLLIIYLYIVYITYLDSLNLSSKIPKILYQIFSKPLIKLILLSSTIYIIANINVEIGVLLLFSYVLTINVLDKRIIEETFFTDITEGFEDAEIDDEGEDEYEYVNDITEDTSDPEVNSGDPDDDLEFVKNL